jgi:hypothetical protein
VAFVSLCFFRRFFFPGGQHIKKTMQALIRASPKDYRKCAIRMTVAVLVVALLMRFADPRPLSQNDAMSKVLVENAIRLYNVAQQDLEPSLRLQHASMAVANIEAVRQLFADNVIEKATGHDVHELTQSLQKYANGETVAYRHATPGPQTRRLQKLPLWE